jgi:hypothetical protein
MNEVQILVPREHDSFSALTINGGQYLLRFSYNDTFDYWTFGIYELNRKPIIEGLKIVPNFPLNLFLRMRRFGDTCFIATSKQQHIGRRDFWDGNAQFWMVTKTNG